MPPPTITSASAMPHPAVGPSEPAEPGDNEECKEMLGLVVAHWSRIEMIGVERDEEHASRARKKYQPNDDAEMLVHDDLCIRSSAPSLENSSP